VLVCVDDVAPGVGQEAADSGDQTGPVGTDEEQARSGLRAGDAGMITS
jgi:hypothetical protein